MKWTSCLIPRVDLRWNMSACVTVQCFGLGPGPPHSVSFQPFPAVTFASVNAGGSSFMAVGVNGELW